MTSDDRREIEKLKQRLEDAEDQLLALRRLPERMRDLWQELEDLKELVEIRVLKRLAALTRESADGEYRPASSSFDLRTWLGVTAAIVIPIVLTIVGTR